MISLGGGTQQVAEIRFTNQDRTNTINNGTLQTSLINGLGSGGNLGTVNLPDVSQLGTGLSVDIISGEGITLSGVVTSTNFSNDGAGTVTLDNTSNSMSGTATAQLGRINVNGPGALGSATAIIGGGTFAFEMNTPSASNNYTNPIVGTGTGNLFVFNGGFNQKNGELGAITLNDLSNITMDETGGNASRIDSITIPDLTVVGNATLHMLMDDDLNVTNGLMGSSGMFGDKLTLELNSDNGDLDLGAASMIDILEVLAGNGDGQVEVDVGLTLNQLIVHGMDVPAGIYATNDALLQGRFEGPGQVTVTGLEPPSTVPEPASIAIWMLLALACGGFGCSRIRRKR